MPKPLTQLGQRGIGLLLEFLAYHRKRRWITAGLATSRMRPGRNLARAAAPLDELLDKGAADAKERRKGPLRAAVLIIGTKDFLAKIQGVGFHVAHTRPWLPFIQLQTALIGGGQVPMPGDVTRVHHGVVFLEERPVCRRHVLGVLRQPLEAGVL